MALFTNHANAPLHNTELPNTTWVYGDVFPAEGAIFTRSVTMVEKYAYKILFLTESAAQTGAEALQHAFNDEALLTTPQQVSGTARAVRAYACGGYDIEVNYCKTTQTFVTVVP